MTKIKKIVTATIAAATVSAIGLTAYAADYNHSFYFKLAWHGGHQFSPSAVKQNELNYARVNAHTGSVTEENFVSFAVFSDNTSVGKNCVSESYRIEDLRREFSLRYTTERGKGTYNYLCGFAGYNGATVNGKWEP